MEDFIIRVFESYPVLGTILAGLLAAHALAIFIVNLTPTPKDNLWLGRVYWVVEWLAGIVTPISKDKGSVDNGGKK